MSISDEGEATKMTDIFHWLLSGLVRLVLAILAAAARFLSVFFCTTLAAGYYHIGRTRRAIVMDNLRTAFGEEKSADELRTVAKNFYRNMGLFIVEFARIGKLDEEYVKDNVTFKGLSHIDEALSKGKGVVLLTAHFANWELLGAVLAIRGYRLSTVARPLGNRFLNDYLDSTRIAHGNGVIEKKRAIRHMMELLKDGGTVGILLDQRTNLKEGVMVDFFGRPAPTSKGLAAVVARSGTPVVPVFMLRDGMSKFTVECAPPVEVVSTGDKEADIVENTRRFSLVIESYIRKRPDHWLWFHSRWAKSWIGEEKRRKRKEKKNRERDRLRRASRGRLG